VETPPPLAMAPGNSASTVALPVGNARLRYQPLSMVLSPKPTN
jgi:hypothetical protein